MTLKLKVPVYAEEEVVDGEQQMKIYRDGKIEYAEAPRPFFYTDFELNDAPESVSGLFYNIETEPVRMKPVGKDSNETWFKHTANNMIVTKHIMKQVREAGKRTDLAAEEIVQWLGQQSQRTSRLGQRYTDFVMTVEPDYFRKYETNAVKVMTFDIEQLSEGKGFEETKRNPLISIAVGTYDENGIFLTRYFECEKDDDGRIRDRKMLMAFKDLYTEFNPDVLVTFNGNGYDIPVMCYRMEKNKISTKFWDREGVKAPYFNSYTNKGKEIHKCFINGRVSFDVLHSVELDQTLTGEVKNRKLKTIARYYQSKGVIPADIEIEEEDMVNNSHLVGTETLKKYNISDVNITWHLFAMYFKNVVAVAEFIGCPLNHVVPLSTSYPYTLTCSRIFHENGLLSIAKNKFRNHEHWPVVGKPYGGGFSEAFKKGVYHDVYEADVASMHPSIMVALGLGPDNVKILRTEPLSSSELVRTYGFKPSKYYRMRAEQHGDRRIYYVPEPELNFTWVIEVTGYSPLATATAEFLKDRMKLKKLSKDESQPAGIRAAAYSRAYGLKVVLNSNYGGSGDAFNDYGELGMAALITGMSREILNKCVEWGGVDDILMVDTDSVKFPFDLNMDEMNKFTDDFMQNEFYGKPSIVWEKERFEAIHIHAAKNYLLLEKDNDTGKLKLKIHGVAFKSSRASPLHDKIINEVGYKMLCNGYDATRGFAARFYDMRNLTMDDLKMGVRLGKRPEEYKTETLAVKVANKYNEANGTPIAVGNHYEYIKVKGGYDIPSPEAMRRVDEKYYRKVIDKAIALLGYQNIFNATLEEFF